MLRIRDYENFRNAMKVLSDGYYQQLHHDYIHETQRRIEILKLNNLPKYKEWWERWRMERD